MKKINKQSLSLISGGAPPKCIPDNENKTTFCSWQDGTSGKFCTGVYTWSGETIFLNCSDGYIFVRKDC